MTINSVVLAALFCELMSPALVQVQAQQCSGAPTYSCARTDTNITTLPSQLPFAAGITGANTQFVDSSFNSQYPVRYTRVTGYYFGGRYGLVNGGSFAVGSGSGDDAHFNADESIFSITDQNADWYFVGLNPSTMQTGLLYATANASNVIWSQTNRNYAYELSNVGTGLYRMDFTGCYLGGPTCTPVVTLFYDFANCGVPSGSAFSEFGGIGGNDNVFIGGVAPQDANHYIVAYNASMQTCYLYNTKARTVTEYNSNYPSGNLLGSVTTTDSYTVHNVRIDPSGTWMTVDLGEVCYSSGCWLERAWQIGTLTVNACQFNGGADSGWCEGHNSQTATGWLNADQNWNLNTTQIPCMQFRTWANMTTTNYSNVTQLVTGAINLGLISFDDHPTTKNDPSGTNGYPIFSSTYTAEASVGAITVAYSNEVIAWTQTPGPPLRFGHTFNSSLDTAQFTAQYAIGSVSPLGDFYLYTTDGEGTFGSTSGGTTCSVTGGTCRSDVFLMALTSAP